MSTDKTPGFEGRDMRLRTCYLSLAMIGVAVLTWLTWDDRWELAYCTHCGLLKSTHYRVCLGFSGKRTASYPDTEYHRLRLAMGQGPCIHNWKACYENHHRVYAGAVQIPIVLSSYGGLRDRMTLLRRLGDRAKISAVLASFDLSRGNAEDFDYVCSVLPALDELKDVPATLSEEQWWSKNKHLFSDRPTDLPPREAEAQASPRQ